MRAPLGNDAVHGSVLFGGVRHGREAPSEPVVVSGSDGVAPVYDASGVISETAEGRGMLGSSVSSGIRGLTPEKVVRSGEAAAGATGRAQGSVLDGGGGRIVAGARARGALHDKGGLDSQSERERGVSYESNMWVEAIDNRTGEMYFYAVGTKETVWERPRGPGVAVLTPAEFKRFRKRMRKNEHTGTESSETEGWKPRSQVSAGTPPSRWAPALTDRSGQLATVAAGEGLSALEDKSSSAGGVGGVRDGADASGDGGVLLERTRDVMESSTADAAAAAPLSGGVSEEGGIFARVSSGVSARRKENMWVEVGDAMSGQAYFFNAVSKETSWTQPVGAIILSAVEYRALRRGARVRHPRQNTATDVSSAGGVHDGDDVTVVAAEGHQLGAESANSTAVPLADTGGERNVSGASRAAHPDDTSAIGAASLRGRGALAAVPSPPLQSVEAVRKASALSLLPAPAAHASVVEEKRSNEEAGKTGVAGALTSHRGGHGVTRSVRFGATHTVEIPSGDYQSGTAESPRTSDLPSAAGAAAAAASEAVLPDPSSVWIETVDTTSDLPYYYNAASKASSWERPVGAVTVVSADEYRRLKRRLRRRRGGPLAADSSGAEDSSGLDVPRSAQPASALTVPRVIGNAGTAGMGVLMGAQPLRVRGSGSSGAASFAAPITAPHIAEVVSHAVDAAVPDAAPPGDAATRHMDLQMAQIWIRTLEQASGESYYFNAATKQSVWSPPSEGRIMTLAEYKALKQEHRRRAVALK